MHWGECGIRLTKNDEYFICFRDYRVNTLTKAHIKEILFQSIKIPSEDWYIVYSC
jgi:hypothetical protein